MGTAEKLGMVHSAVRPDAAGTATRAEFGEFESEPESLLELLWTHEHARLSLIEDACSLIETEATRARGLQAATRRACYRSVQAVAPGTVAYVLGKLMPKFLTVLQPTYTVAVEAAAMQTSCPAATFRELLEVDPAAVAGLLLGVTDAHIDTARFPIRIAYKAIRHESFLPVRDTVPAIGVLLERHLQRR